MYWYVTVRTRMYNNVLVCTGMYYNIWDVLVCTSMFKFVLLHTSMYLYIPGMYCYMFWYVPVFLSVLSFQHLVSTLSAKCKYTPNQLLHDIFIPLIEFLMDLQVNILLVGRQSI